MFQRKKVLKYYNEKIRDCDDKSYSWQELNCFYRPFAISLGAERYHMFLLLVSLYMTHSNVENGKVLFNRLHPAMQYFEKEIKSVLNADISVVEYSSEKDMHKKLEDVLSDGYLAIVPNDLYLLSYSQNYMEQHHRHYTLVKGFDSTKRIYYILDNMQNELGESVRYSDFMMQYNQIYSGTQEFHRNYDKMCSLKPYFWKVRAKGPDSEAGENVRKYLIRVLEGFTMKAPEPYYVEWNMIDGKISGHMLDNVEQINQRNVYYGEFIKYLDKIGCSIDESLLKMTEELKKNWNIIKIQIMRGSLDAAKRLRENIMLEECFHIKVLDILKNSKAVCGKQSKKDYIIANELNAGMKQEDGRWRIELSPDLVYDTWKLKDDACQILYPVDENTAGIEVCMQKEVITPGSGFHIGIILKSDSGKKLLYGNSRNIHIVIFEPEKDDYEIYQSDYSFGDIDRLKVEFDNKNDVHIFSFYAMGSESGVWEKIYSAQSEFMPDYAGMFVKSWERCACVVEAEVRKV